MEHVTNLLSNLASLYPVSNAFRDTFIALPVLKRLQRGQMLELPGPACVYYIIKGLAKGSYDDLDGSEDITRRTLSKTSLQLL